MSERDDDRPSARRDARRAASDQRDPLGWKQRAGEPGDADDRPGGRPGPGTPELGEVDADEAVHDVESWYDDEAPPLGGGAPSGDDADDAAEGAPPRRPTPLTQQIGRVTLVVLLVVFVVFAFANSHRVDFSWLAGRAEVVEVAGETQGGVPLILLLVVAFVLGLLVGVIAEWQLLRSRRHRR